MYPSELRLHLIECIKANQPAMIWGAPGIGKSEIIKQIADELKDGNLIDFRLAMRDPTSVTGYHIPDMKKKVMSFLKDEELPTSGSGILLMDELPSALPATQAAGMQLTLSRKSGSYELPPDWYICAAGNRLTDQAIVYKMPSALSYRLTHFDLEPHLPDWIDWALANDVPSILISFLRFREELFYKEDYTLRAAPNPRAWERVGKFINSGITENTLLRVASGCVGEGAGTEFYAFFRTWESLVSLDEIMVSPQTVDIPTAPDVLYALSGMLASGLSEITIPRLMPFIERIPTEFQILTVRDALARKAKIDKTREFLKWIQANQQFIK